MCASIVTGVDAPPVLEPAERIFDLVPFAIENAVMFDRLCAVGLRAAVRDYVRSDFALSALNADGTINPARATSWSRNNSDVLAQFPAVRQEFDGIVRSAQRGEQMTAEAKT